MAATFMENVPPSGWSDVAQRSDFDLAVRELRGELNLFRVDIERLRIDVDKLDRKLNMVIGFGLTFGLALLALQVQIMLSIASL